MFDIMSAHPAGGAYVTRVLVRMHATQAPLTRPAPAGESAGSAPPSPARGEG